MEARSKTVENWFAMIREGEMSLPRFQRFESWRPVQVEGVFENILRAPSLPIGALLVLEVGDEELFVSRAISGAPPAKSKPQLNLLDGQQRMTALWRALNDDYQEMQLVVHFNNDDDGHPDVEVVRRYIHSKTNKNMPRWIDSPKECFDRGVFPLSLLCPGSEGEKKCDVWLSDAEAKSSDMKKLLNMRNRLANYAIPFLSLPVTTEKETALDVFINMNTSASPLKDFDIVVAQLEGAVGKSLHDMIEELHAAVPDAKDFGRMEDVALSVGALLNDKPPLKRTFLGTDGGGFGKELAAVWPQVISGLERGIAFLRDESIFNESLLPTDVLVYLTSALWSSVPMDGTDVEGRARTIIRKAIWRASFTDRYLKTATTRAFADYRGIRDLIKDPKSITAIPLFDDEHATLPAAEELYRGGWPSRKDRLGRAVLVASLYDGGFDFADGAKASPTSVRSRELHHIFPKALISNDYSESLVNSSLNCALISWKTNRIISAKTPEAYINERASDAGASEAEVKSRLKSHRVPYKPLIGGDFEKFIDKRAKMIYKTMVQLCNGEVAS